MFTVAYEFAGVAYVTWEEEEGNFFAPDSFSECKAAIESLSTLVENNKQARPILVIGVFTNNEKFLLAAAVTLQSKFSVFALEEPEFSDVQSEIQISYLDEFQEGEMLRIGYFLEKSNMSESESRQILEGSLQDWNSSWNARQNAS